MLTENNSISISVHKCTHTHTAHYSSLFQILLHTNKPASKTPAVKQLIVSFRESKARGQQSTLLKRTRHQHANQDSHPSTSNKSQWQIGLCRLPFLPCQPQFLNDKWGLLPSVLLSSCSASNGYFSPSPYCTAKH